MTPPWQVPKSWQWSNMAAVSSVIGGGTPSTHDPANFGGEVPWLTPADLSGFSGKYISSGKRSLTKQGLEGSSAHMVPAGSILFTSRAPVGYVAIAEAPVCTNQGFKSFVLEPDIVPSYCYYYLLSARAHIQSMASGTTFLELPTRKARKVPIPIAPKQEQIRIAVALDKVFSDLDTCIATLQRCQEKLARYRASVLKAAVEGDLTADWRKKHPDVEPASKLLQRILAERRQRWEQEQQRAYAEKGKAPPKNWKAKYKEPVDVDQIDLPPLPAGWTWATLDQLAAPEQHAITDGPFGSNLKTSHYTSTGPRVIRLQNIGDGEFVDAEAHISHDHFQTLKKHEARAGDIILASLGTSLPRSCVLPDHVGPAIVKADCVRFRPNATMSTACINHFLNANPTRQRAKRLIHGVGRPRLGLRSLRTVAIPVAPREEQCAIAEAIRNQLAGIQDVESTLASDLLRATRLRQSILHRAFTGNLLPQDSSDEPAAKLLERITRERKARQRRTTQRSHRSS